MTTVSYGLVPEPSQVQEIAGYIARLHDPSERFGDAQILEKFKELLLAKKFGDLFTSILDELPFVFENGDGQDIETLWVTFASLVIKLGGNYTAKLAPPLFKGLTSAVDSKRSIRLSTLSHLYNLHHAPQWRFAVLETIINYAIESDQTSSVLGFFTDIETTLASFVGIKDERKKALFDLLFVCIGEQNMPLLYSTHVKYLKMFEKDSDISTMAAKILGLHIRLSGNFYEKDFLDLPAVQTIKDKPIYELFKIFKFGSYDDFVAFADKNSAFFAEYDLDVDALRRKIRLLSLGSLAHGHDSLTFDEVAKAIEVDESEVEFWLVEAMSADILKVRVDRPKKQITVRSAASRSLDTTDWKRLNERVIATKANLQSLLQSVQAVGIQK